MNVQDLHHLHPFYLFILASVLLCVGAFANKYVKDKNGGKMPALRSPLTIILISFGDGTGHHDDYHCGITKETNHKALCDVIPVPILVPNPLSFTLAMMSIGDILLFLGFWVYAVFLGKIFGFIS